MKFECLVASARVLRFATQRGRLWSGAWDRGQALGERSRRAISGSGVSTRWIRPDPAYYRFRRTPRRTEVVADAAVAGRRASDAHRTFVSSIFSRSGSAPRRITGL
jgi:hypothetical protein